MRQPSRQRTKGFIEPYSGLYFQISGTPTTFLPIVRDRRLRVMEGHGDVHPHLYDSNEFSTPTSAEPLRIAERDVILPRIEGAVALPGRAIARDDRRANPPASLHLDLELHGLGIGLLVLAALQTFYAYGRCGAHEVALIRSGEKTRIGHDFPTEIRPPTEEINQLLAHSEAQAEEARRHACNLAHALKTPLTVITNAATAKAPDLRTPSAERRP